MSMRTLWLLLRHLSNNNHIIIIIINKKQRNRLLCAFTIKSLYTFFYFVCPYQHLLNGVTASTSVNTNSQLKHKLDRKGLARIIRGLPGCVQIVNKTAVHSYMTILTPNFQSYFNSVRKTVSVDQRCLLSVADNLSAEARAYYNWQCVRLVLIQKKTKLQKSQFVFRIFSDL